MGDCFAPLGPPLLPWDLMAQTDRQTDGHGDSMTNSAQWGRVGENYEYLVQIGIWKTLFINGHSHCNQPLFQTSLPIFLSQYLTGTKTKSEI